MNRRRGWGLSQFSRQDLGLEDAVHVGCALRVESRAQIKHLGVGLGGIDRVFVVIRFNRVKRFCC